MSFSTLGKTMICAFVAGIPSTGDWLYAGQENPAPQALLTDNTLLFCSSQDFGECLNSLKKNWYDNVYRSLHDHGQLLGLETPSTKYVFRLQRKTAIHWMENIFESLKQVDSTTGKQLLEQFAEFKKNDFSPACSIEPELFNTLTSMFPGEVFVAIVDDRPYFKTVFGVQYNSESFDWFEELKATAKANSNGSNNVQIVQGVKVYHNPFEGIYFFSRNDMVYGVSETEIDYCRVLIERLLKLEEVKSGFSDSLENTRSFKRLSQVRTINNGGMESDLFVYAKLDELITRLSRPHKTTPIQLPNGEEFGDVESDSGAKGLEFVFGKNYKPTTSVGESVSIKNEAAGWASSVGVFIGFDDAQHATQYQIVYPLIVPLQKQTNRILSDGSELSSDCTLCLVPNTLRVITKKEFAHQNYTWDSWDSVSPSRFEQAEDVNLYSVMQHVSTELGTGGEICTFVFGLPSEVNLEESCFEGSELFVGTFTRLNSRKHLSNLFERLEQILTTADGKRKSHQLLSQLQFEYVNNWSFDEGLLKNAINQPGQVQNETGLNCFRKIELAQGFTALYIGTEKPAVIVLSDGNWLAMIPNICLTKTDVAEEILNAFIGEGIEEVKYSALFGTNAKAKIRSFSADRLVLGASTMSCCLFELNSFIDHCQRQSQYGLASFKLRNGVEHLYGRNFDDSRLSFLYKLGQVVLAECSSLNDRSCGQMRGDIGSTVTDYRALLTLGTESFHYLGMVKPND